MVSLMSPRLEKVHVKNIHQLTSRVRMYIDEEYLNRMIEDVRKHEILQPPILIKVDNGLYSIVDGFHRIEAAKKIGMEYVDALVYDKDETDPFIEGFRRNLFQKSLDPISIAYGIRELLNKHLSWDEIEELTGFSEKHCRRYLQLLNLPQDIQDRIGRGELSPFGEEVKKYVEGQNVRKSSKKTSNLVRCPICGCFPEKGKGKWLYFCEDHVTQYTITFQWLKSEGYKNITASISPYATSPATIPNSINLLTYF